MENLKAIISNIKIRPVVFNKVILTTYADTDSNDRSFTISNRIFKKLILEEGWKNKKEFLDNYIYDDAEIIYDQAKALNCILSEELIEPYM